MRALLLVLLATFCGTLLADSVEGGIFRKCRRKRCKYSCSYSYSAKYQSQTVAAADSPDQATVLRTINLYRQAHGRGILKRVRNLGSQAWANRRLRRHGATSAREIIYWGGGDPVAWWKSSRDHNAVLLMSSATVIDIGESGGNWVARVR